MESHMSSVSLPNPTTMVNTYLSRQSSNARVQANIALMKKNQDLAGQSVLKLLEASNLGKNINTYA